LFDEDSEHELQYIASKCGLKGRSGALFEASDAIFASACERGTAAMHVHVHFNRVGPTGVMRNHKVARNYVLASHLRHARHMDSCLCYDLMIHLPHIPSQTILRTPPAPIHTSNNHNGDSAKLASALARELGTHMQYLGIFSARTST
jgi:hypothetical protein